MVDKNELSILTSQIIVTQGAIEGFNYEELKEEAERLAIRIANVEVSEENIKQSKKLLAGINKKIKELESMRIQIKKKMMEPYSQFEAEVRDIVQIVKEADEIVRDQVRDLEEMDRIHKENLIEGIFRKRIRHYSFRDLFHFTDFLKPKHLNKTTTLDQVEKEMVDFLEKITKDLKVIESMPDSKSILSAYIDSKDLASAIYLVNQEKERIAQIEASKALKTNKSAKISFLVSIAVKTQKDLKFLELLLNENDIKFSVDKIENGVN